MSKQQSLNKFYANKFLIKCPKTVVFGHFERHTELLKKIREERISEYTVKTIKISINHYYLQICHLLNFRNAS
jgi:hypothetical protein